MPDTDPPLGGLRATPEPLAPTPVIAPQPGGLGAPPTLESLAQQIADLQAQIQTLQTAQRTVNDDSSAISALQTQVQQMSTNINALNQSFTVLDVEYKLHTHVIAPYQATVPGPDHGISSGLGSEATFWTVPAMSLGSGSQVFGVTPPPSNPVRSGPPGPP